MRGEARSAHAALRRGGAVLVLVEAFAVVLRRDGVAPR